MANFTLTAGADLWQPGVARDVLTGSFANLSSADVGTARAGQFAVLGNGGSDTIDASLVGAAGRITLVAGGGNDTFLGGAGNDLARFNAIELTAADSINAGAGFDTLRLDTAGALAADALANVRRIEPIELATSGSSVSIAQAMAASADGGVLAVVARGGANVVDASAATTAVNYFAGTGADGYVGGTGVDRVHVAPSTLTSADSFQGGGGAAIDMIRITAPGAFAPNAFDGVRGFERIQMSAGGNAITLNDAVLIGVASTAFVIGDAGNDSVDASAMTRPITFDRGLGGDVFSVAAATISCWSIPLTSSVSTCSRAAWATTPLCSSRPAR
jgi:Ca2+-binding RTX toxin-like protein